MPTVLPSEGRRAKTPGLGSLRPTVGNTVGTTTPFSARYPLKHDYRCDSPMTEENWIGFVLEKVMLVNGCGTRISWTNTSLISPRKFKRESSAIEVKTYDSTRLRTKGMWAMARHSGLSRGGCSSPHPRPTRGFCGF